MPNQRNIVFQETKKGSGCGKRFYNTNNQPKKATFKYKQEGRFCLGVAKVEIQDGKIIGKRCPVFDYTEKKVVTIDACKKEIMNEFARIRKLN